MLLLAVQEVQKIAARVYLFTFSWLKLKLLSGLVLELVLVSSVNNDEAQFAG